MSISHCSYSLAGFHLSKTEDDSEALTYFTQLSLRTRGQVSWFPEYSPAKAYFYPTSVNTCIVSSFMSSHSLKMLFSK